MRIIYTRKGEEIFVDESCYDELSQFTWRIDNEGYVRRKRLVAEKEVYKKTVIFMHHQVLGVINESSNTLVADHKNGNRADNTSNNLRYTSKSINKLNSKIQSNNKSGYRGVTFNNRRSKFVATIQYNKVRKEIGCYDTVEEAAIAYNHEAIKLHGENAKLNYIRSVG